MKNILYYKIISLYFLIYIFIIMKLEEMVNYANSIKYNNTIISAIIDFNKSLIHNMNNI